ncbi:MAG: hypothetical protein U0Q15_02840 [Kineosporiaceae bacterium]
MTSSTPVPGAGLPQVAGPHAARSLRVAGALAVLVGVLAAFLAVLATPGTTPPLYDGLGFPDEPYRWLQPPPGAPTTPDWTPATGRLDVADGWSQSGSFASAEQGPQVLFFADPKAFAVPAGTTHVDVAARAVPQPGPLPEGTTAVSNTYRFTATPVGGSGELHIDKDRKFLVNLRADKPTDQVVLLHQWDGSRWLQRATFQTGTDIYAGTVQVLGDYVLLRMPPGASISVQHSQPSGSPSAGASDSGDAAGEPAAGADADGPAPASSGAVWWAVAVVAGLLGGGLVVLRLVLQRRAAASAGVGADPPANPGSPGAG